MQPFLQFQKHEFPPCIVEEITILVIYSIILAYSGEANYSHLETCPSINEHRVLNLLMQVSSFRESGQLLPESTLTGCLWVKLLSVKARQFFWIRCHLLSYYAPPNYCEINLDQRFQISKWTEGSSPFPPAYSVMPNWMFSHQYISLTISF